MFPYTIPFESRLTYQDLLHALQELDAPPLLSIHCPRDYERKHRKRANRVRRIKYRVNTLLINCPGSIVTKEVLSVEEVQTLKEIYFRVCRGMDYYPVPKVIHQKIRRYTHYHKCGDEDNLLEVIRTFIC